MNFNDMHAWAKRIDAQVKTLETKISHPMGMMYSNNSSQGVKVLSLLNGMIDDVKTKKKNIDHLIQEENAAWSGLVEDYNTVEKFKSDVVANLNEYENMWLSHYPNYKSFISYGHTESANEELDSLNDLNIQDDRFVSSQIADQSLNDSFNNITIS